MDQIAAHWWLAALAGICLPGLAGFAAAQEVQPPRIGDPGSVFDPAKYDESFPDSREWAKAGVEGGIPFRWQTPIVRRLKPGDDVAAAVKGAGRGVVLLAPGVYQLDQTIALPSGVILRGEDKDTTILEYGVNDKDFRNLVMMRKVERAGVEDLTMRQAKVFAMDPKEYVGKYANHPGFVRDNAATIEMVGAANCWVQNCNIVFSLSRPVRVYGDSRHVTFRDNYVDKCLHRGGQGAGYYEVVGGSHVLIYNETIKNIRHVCLDARIEYTVLIHCKLSVDVNWHCIPPMSKSLVERLDSDAEAVGHRWPTFCHYRDKMAPDNLIYMCKPGYDDGSVYYPTLDGPGQFIRKKDVAPPKFGTLYPVTGVHRPPDAPQPAPAAPAAEAAPQKKTTPAATAPAQKPEARRPGPETIAEWDGQLRARVQAELAAGRRPRFLLSALRQTVEVFAADAQGVLKLRGGGLETPLPFAKLDLNEKKGLALGLAREDDPESHALAAFYCLLCGEDQRARELLSQAGQAGARVKALFE